MPSAPPTISAVILAGGQARRMGSVDKGLQPLLGKPLIQWVIERIAPQVETLVISANRNLDAYRQFDYPVLTDDLPDFQGPLAGVFTAMQHVQSPYLLVVPCDTPLLPADLIRQLWVVLEEQSADIAVAATAEAIHFAIFLCKIALADSLKAYLNQGKRQVAEWQAQHNTKQCFFTESGAFSNLNSTEELAAFARQKA